MLFGTIGMLSTQFHTDVVSLLHMPIIDLYESFAAIKRGMAMMQATK